MGLSFLLNFMKVQNAAKANHLSGWIATAVAGGAAWLVSAGYVEQVRVFVCQSSDSDIGLMIATIGAGASLLNSGTTAALSPKQAPTDSPEPKNSDLERVSQPYPVQRD